MPTQSIRGSFYFLAFINDFRRKVWIHFLINKAKTFFRFKELKALTKKKFGMFIKMLRSDGGGEYDSNDFSDFYKHHGI